MDIIFYFFMVQMLTVKYQKHRMSFRIKFRVERIAAIRQIIKWSTVSTKKKILTHFNLPPEDF